MSTPTLTYAFSSMTRELSAMLALYGRALTEPGECRIADLSECARRCASLAADTHARLLAAFCPPLPRASAVLLCERLHGVAQALLSASMMLPPTRTPTARLGTQVQGLCRMGELLQREVDGLPCLIKGRGIVPPDTDAYHAEHTRFCAAHALLLTHGAQSLGGRFVLDGLWSVQGALSEAYTALLVLFAQAL